MSNVYRIDGRIEMQLLYGKTYFDLLKKELENIADVELLRPQSGLDGARVAINFTGGISTRELTYAMIKMHNLHDKEVHTMINYGGEELLVYIGDFGWLLVDGNSFNKIINKFNKLAE